MTDPQRWNYSIYLFRGSTITIEGDRHELDREPEQALGEDRPRQETRIRVFDGADLVAAAKIAGFSRARVEPIEVRFVETAASAPPPE